MPRIDDKNFQKKVFKKTEYRSWNDNLLEQLRLSPEKKDSTTNDTLSKKQKVPSKKNDNLKNAPLVPHKSSDCVPIVFNKSSDCAQLVSDKSSDCVQLDTNISVQLGFKTDRLEVKKLIERLGGNEKKIFYFIVNICSIKGTTTTGEISGNELMKTVGTTKNGRETALRRLRDKGLLQREEGRRGANGTINLHITELIKMEALNYLNSHMSKQELLGNSIQLLLNNSSNSVQLNTNSNAQLGFNSPLYSSSNINTTTNLSEDWKKIDYEPLSHIGFTENHLKQLIGKNTPDIVQDSINHFAYGLESNPKTKEYAKDGKNPLNILIGVLRKGQAWIENHYRSSQEIAQEKFIERKREEQERLKKLDEEVYSLALGEWKKSLSKEEISKIAPCGKDLLSKKKQEIDLSVYFREEKWPSIRNDYLFEK